MHLAPLLSRPVGWPKDSYLSREVLSLKGEELSLLTDLYQLTMAQSYFQSGNLASATFSLYVRSYPPDRGYLVAAGLEGILSYLQDWEFSAESIDYLRGTSMFHSDFLDFLGGLHFTGDAWAMPEGSIFFTEEPILEVTAPIVQAQAVETFILNQMHFQSLIATKATRCVEAAQGREVTDFALRRTHGTDAGMKVARSSYIGGFHSTSNVLAGKLYGIPTSGTMAHSFVTAFQEEEDSFRAYGNSFPQRSVFLIDTYDTIGGAHRAVNVAQEMEARGDRLVAVRLDSGDFASLSRRVRDILDEAGLGYVKIVASGGLDEHDIDRLVEAGAPIDIFGVGTKMGVSADAPYSDMAYKMVCYDGRPVMKLSRDKVSLPGEKQVHRMGDGHGKHTGDVIALRGETVPEGEPVLHKVMEGGKALGPSPSLDQIRQRLTQGLDCLDAKYRSLRNASRYPVSLSPALEKLSKGMERDLVSQRSDSGSDGPQ